MITTEPQPNRIVRSSTGETKSIRAQFQLAPSVNDTLNTIADKEQTSRNDIIERAILAYAKGKRK